MTDVAIVGFAQSAPGLHREATTGGIDMLLPLLEEVKASTGLTKADIDFWCSGSSDYLAGRAFSFVTAVDALGAYPPIMESHVEADGAWALYEAWIKILTGEAEVALVYGFGKSTAGDLNRVLALQLDPYLVAPMWPDAVSLAALQARLGIEAGLWSEKDMAAVASRSPLYDENSAYIADPLRAHDCLPYADGASVVVLASAAKARTICERPAWITGLAHRVDPHSFALRDLTASSSARLAGIAAGASDVELASLCAPFSHQEIILRNALGLSDNVILDDPGTNPMFAAGLARIGTAASHVMSGRVTRALGHATSGPLLQQNLVCVVAASPDASAGTPTAGTPDAGTPDAGTPDAGTPAAGTPDADEPSKSNPGAISAVDRAKSPIEGERA